MKHLCPMNSPLSLLTASFYIYYNGHLQSHYCCSGSSATKYFPFQTVIVNNHVLWLPTKRRTMHEQVLDPGHLGFTLLWEQFCSDIFPREWNVWQMEGKYGGAIGGFYHATNQKQVLSSKEARLGTSLVLQRKIEAQQVYSISIKTSYSTWRIYPSSGPKSGSNVPSSAWSKSSSSSSALSKSSSSSSSPPTPLLY